MMVVLIGVLRFRGRYWSVTELRTVVVSACRVGIENRTGGPGLEVCIVPCYSMEEEREKKRERGLSSEQNTSSERLAFRPFSSEKHQLEVLFGILLSRVLKCAAR